MKIDIEFWGVMTATAMWFWYAWMTDTTRVTHPDHKSSSAYQSCLRSADFIYSQRLEEAIDDPSLWRLAGYRNAQEYAERARLTVRSNCGR